MNKDYAIFLKEEYTKVGVYVVPHGVEMKNKSLFTISIGYIDLDNDPHLFKCTDSSRMTLEIMQSILSSWQQWEVDREKLPR
tara:strand:+ start:578 stop:823 length:246 start_codon:yes stop_codon:yes gene_type:complete